MAKTESERERESEAYRKLTKHYYIYRPKCMRICVKFKIAEKTLIPVIAFNIHHSLELLYTLIVMAFLHFRQTTKANMLRITIQPCGSLIEMLFSIHSISDDDIYRLEARIIRQFYDI